MGKIKNAIYRFMYGRYGHDSLNSFLLVSSFLILFINLFFIRNNVVAIISYLGILYTTFRAYSRKIYNRQKENNRFLKIVNPIRKRFKNTKHALNDRTHRYYLCPNCQQQVRVPKGRGTIEITCPKCKHKFTKKT